MRRLRKWGRMLPRQLSLPEEQPTAADETAMVSPELEANERYLRDVFQDCSDLVYRSVRLKAGSELLVVFVSSLVNEQIIDDHVLKPMLSLATDVPATVDDCADALLTAGTIERTPSMTTLIRKLLDGYAIVLVPAGHNAITVKASGIKQRSLEEPSSEPVIRGPRDGFIENIAVNMGLLRNRLKTSRLKTESFMLGELTQTQVIVVYLSGIVSPALLEEVKTRVKGIRVDGIIDSGYVEEFIEDLPYSPFPQVHSTERPDAVAAELLEGRIAILVDNTPFVLVLPMTLWTGLQASEDYYIRWPIATFVRWIRFLFIFIAIFAPPLYVAVTTFHQEMIPTNLVLSIASSREAVPFPALIEALLMEIIFEALREAGIRLPKQIGQAVSIVGALVIGQAAVQAGIISAPVVIIVSITGIAAFTIPRYSFANGVRLLRFPMLFLAGTLGLYGIVLGFLGILLHLASLRSFGIPYFTPVSFGSLKDILIRSPIWARTTRSLPYERSGKDQ
ncbi:spore germination protein [Paenibacillus rhizovicinus]|uniref:Spore germination protein n=1 Tax=Paenibacillus rhizovicinus TaxID=2704463 RepID=A0A6C0NTS6_9BACL|nr:spore germination protein [Paenibacillus rhizovicinus]QHW29614.1 spore germination protein [Paenibacillus rhizovicinus]